MGSYQLINNELHYTGDGWQTVKLTKKETQQYKEGKLDCFKTFNDGRKIY